MRASDAEESGEQSLLSKATISKTGWNERAVYHQGTPNRKICPVLLPLAETRMGVGWGESSIIRLAYKNARIIA
jgi:hypothetical protein